MTTEEQQHHQDTHQQSSGGGDDDDVVSIVCLHCLLAETIDKWMVDFNQKTGQPVCAVMVANNIGAAMEDFLDDVRTKHGPDALNVVAQAICDGQAAQRARNAEQAAMPAGTTTQH